MIGSCAVSGARAQPAAELDAGQPGSIQSSTTRSGALSFSRVGLVAARDGFDLVAFGFEVVAQQQRSAAPRPRRSGCGRSSGVGSPTRTRTAAPARCCRRPSGARRRSAAALRPCSGPVSAMLVAWSPMRSMFLAQNSRCGAERDVARILHHVGEQLAEQRGVHRVDLLVALPDRDRLGDVAPRIGVEHLLELASTSSAKCARRRGSASAAGNRR